MSTPMQSTSRLLRRPINDRAIAGVASGLGRRFDISPTWFRVGFIVLTLFGGFGVVLYGLGWLLIPDEGTDEPLVAEWIDGFDTSNTGMVIGVVLIGVAVLILLSSFHVLAFSGRFLFAAVLLVAGVLLYRGDLDRTGGLPEEDDQDRGEEDQEEITGQTLVEMGEETGVEEGSPPMEAAIAPAPAPKPRRPRSILGRLTMAVLLIAVGTLAILDMSGVLSPVPVVYAALTVGIIGGGLLVGTLFGRARWLIVVGLILTPFLFLASLGAPAWSINGEAGERYIRVTSIEDIERINYQYEHGAGVLEIDLRWFEPPPGDRPDLYPIPINAKLGVGELRIWLPSPPSATVTANAGIGSVDILGNQSAGLGVSRYDEEPPGGQDRWLFAIEASVGVGSIVVTDARQGREG